jgi:hypothetical protein
VSAQRRRAKAAARASYAVELDLRQAYLQHRVPRLAEAALICSCGFAAWLMPGCDERARDEHDQVVSDHIWMCDGGWAAYDNSERAA